MKTENQVLSIQDSALRTRHSALRWGVAMKQLFSILLVIVVVGVGAPTEAQQPAGKVPRIGILAPGSSAFPDSARYDSFRQGLRELGYIEGKNIFIEIRYAEGKQDRLSDIATELVKLKVDVIVTATRPGVLAARNATSAIPIVFAAVGDPVRAGLVSSLARPGGNITGLSILETELFGKRLELLKETFPKIARVADFRDATSQGTGSAERQAAAQHLGCNFNPWTCGAPKISTVHSKRY